MRKALVSKEDAENIAVQCLAFLAEDADRISRFMALTGVDPSGISSQARDPAFLGAILDYILSDESLLLSFSETMNIPPEHPAIARMRLPGAPTFD